jgi:hypothetical protein
MKQSTLSALTVKGGLVALLLMGITLAIPNSHPGIAKALFSGAVQTSFLDSPRYSWRLCDLA